MKIFGLGNSRGLAADIAAFLGTDPASAREEWRPDGEPWCAAVDNVRGQDVFVVSSLHSAAPRSANDLTLQLLLFIDALKRASAGRVTAVCPYLSFTRQDRKENSREPVSTQALAKMFEAVGTDRILTMDAHNPGALQNAYRIPIDILEARKLLADEVARLVFTPAFSTDGHLPLTVLSPDAGGVKRAKVFQESLSSRIRTAVGFAHANKTRGQGGVSIDEIIGDVHGRRVVILDDMIDTGGTISRLIDAVGAAGGIPWGVVATHGLFNERGVARVSAARNLVVADTVAFDCEGYPARRVRTAPLFAEAIRRIHAEDGSISDLLRD